MKRMEGSSLQVDVMQKVPKLVVHERMSEGKEGKGSDCKASRRIRWKKR